MQGLKGVGSVMLECPRNEEECALPALKRGSQFLRSADQDVEVSCVCELVECGDVHDAIEEAVEQLNVIYLYDLGEDDLEGRTVAHDPLPLFLQKGSDELDV